MKAQTQKQQSSITWTDEQVAQLRMGLLLKYTGILTEGYTYYKAIEDAWEWLVSNDVGEFSFATIVRLHGVDPETFRRQFFGHLVKSKSATRAVRERAAWFLAAAPTGKRRLAA